MENREDEKMLRLYLLGELAEPDMTKLEERLFSDDELNEYLSLIENELTDEYLQGLLSQQQRDKFESHFLAAPERQQKLKIAKALQRYITTPAVAVSQPALTETVVKPNAWWQSLIAFFHRPLPALTTVGISLVLAIVAIWLFTETNRLKQELEQVRLAQRAEPQEELRRQLAEQRARTEELTRQLEQEQERRVQLEEEIANLKRPAPINNENERSALLSFLLMPGLMRGVDPPISVKIPVNVQQVGFELDLEQSGYSNYRAQLLREDGTQIWQQVNLKEHKKGQGKIVLLPLSAKLLVNGSYRIGLSAAMAGGEYEKIGTYYFQVIKE
ncbi:MAG: hypothetical protein AB1489_39575 [Acidobacteriota bacterium]